MSNIVQLIARKRDGEELARSEIDTLIQSYSAGEVPDYQMAAWTMAVYLRGMSVAETAALTEAMLRSGMQLEWDCEYAGRLVDKHSTGGIGDKVSLILAPILAAQDLFVPMVSGRGLGPTGGTLDKLESIHGFRTDLSANEFRSAVEEIGCAITGATGQIAPADKRLYALRDVTATVSSIPLITASILSKKLAEGIDCLVMDVKCGSGAFMKTMDQARELAQSLVATGNAMGVDTKAIISDMSAPLGDYAGNAVEVDEAIKALKGHGSKRMMEVTVQLGCELMLATKRSKNHAEAEKAIQRSIESGTAYEKWEQMVRKQGGNPTASLQIARPHTVESNRSGYVCAINTEQIGWEIISLGGGRQQLTDAIDHSVGIKTEIQIGDQVQAGEPLFQVFADQLHHGVENRIRDLVTISDEPIAQPPVVIEIFEKDGNPSMTNTTDQ